MTYRWDDAARIADALDPEQAILPQQMQNARKALAALSPAASDEGR